MLLVDHNVKSVAALVDRVLAMYLGERVAEGTADEVMRNETVRARLSRRQDRGAARARNATPGAATALLDVRGVERAVRQGAGAGRRVAACRTRASSFRSSG